MGNDENNEVVMRFCSSDTHVPACLAHSLCGWVNAWIHLHICARRICVLRCMRLLLHCLSRLNPKRLNWTRLLMLLSTLLPALTPARQIAQCMSHFLSFLSFHILFLSIYFNATHTHGGSVESKTDEIHIPAPMML